MRKKIFTFLLALTASIGMMWAETVEVKLYKSEFTPSGVTKEGVTLAPSSDESASGSMTSSDVIAMVGSFEFSTSLGKFTRITIATDANIMRIYENGYTSAGWPIGENLGKLAVWTGESETVLISCEVAGMDNITITCTIEPTPATPDWVRDGDTWDDATKTLTVNSNPGKQAYQNIAEIQHVVISNGVTSMDSEVFRYCTGLTSVTIPNSVTSIGYQVFSGCTGLTSVTIPNGVTSIPSSLFYNCSSLTSVTIPNSVTSIANSAFYGCSSLTSVTIPNSVTSIGMQAFYNCTGLTSVTIPNSVTSIEYFAFDGCTNVTDVYCYPLAADLTWNMANNSFKANKVTQCHVFASELSAYQDKFASVRVTFVGDLPAPTPTTPTGDKLPGAFTVDGGKVVYFSKGNLQYVGDNWQFAENQWDVIGASQTNSSRDLFGWGTGNNPNQTSEEYGDYTTFADWGSNMGGDWRTLTQTEWNYILNSRSTNYRFSYATLNIGVQSYNGLIILPDDWDPSYYALSPGSMNQGNHSYDSNVISEEDWTNSLEAHGAVFLPVSGIRTGNEVEELYGDNSTGNYWTSFAVNDANACYLSIAAGWGVEIGATTRCKGLAVRLVSETAPGDPTPTPTPTDEQVPTNADPENPGTYYYSTFFHGTQNYALTNDGTQAFIATLSNNDLVLTEIANGTQVIPANTAVILRKTGSADPVALAPTDEEGVSFSAHNSLEGVDAETAVTSIDGLTTTNCYVLSGTNEHGVGFYRILGSELKAHKAYVKYAGGPSGAPKRMRFIFNQEKVATGVENTDASAKIGGSEKVIENGQLIIIKNGVRYNAQGQIVK